MNIPNSLSLFRILLIPVFILLYFLNPQDGLIPSIILVVSGVTDCLDGWIARRFNLITHLGKILDPLADKLTQLAVCICLAIRHKEFIIILCLLVAKEIIMLVAGYKILRQGVQLPSSKWFGKVATVVFYIMMVYAVYDVTISNMLLAVLVWLVVIFAALSFVQYIPEFFRLYNQENNQTTIHNRQQSEKDKVE